MSYFNLNRSVPDTFAPFYDFMENTGVLDASETHTLAIIINTIIDAKIEKLREDMESRFTDLQNPINYDTPEDSIYDKDEIDYSYQPRSVIHAGGR